MQKIMAIEIIYGCWSGDTPEAHEFRQRRTSSARGGQVQQRLERRAIKKGIKNPASGGGHINSKFQNNVIINSEGVEF